MPPTTLPVILPLPLGGQSQSGFLRVDVPIKTSKKVGVDLFDQFVSTYIIWISSKKWWWLLFTWVVNASMAHAWKLFHTAPKQKNWFVTFPKRSFGRNRLYPYFWDQNTKILKFLQFFNFI